MRSGVFFPQTVPVAVLLTVDIFDVKYERFTYILHVIRRYFQHAYFIPIVGVGKERCILIDPW